MDQERFRQLALVMGRDGIYRPARRPSFNRWLVVALVLALVMRSATADSSAGSIRITSGNGSVNAAVKAGSVLPSASDGALVVTLRDAPPGTTSVQGLGTAGSQAGGVQTVQGDPSNQPLPVSTTGSTVLATSAVDQKANAATLSATCTTATACSASSSIQWAATGTQSAEVVVTAISSPVGITTVCDTSYDGGTTYLLASCIFTSSAGVEKGTSLANGDLAAATYWRIKWDNAPSNIRVRISALTSGSFTAAGRAVLAPGFPPFIGAAVAGGMPKNVGGNPIGVPELLRAATTTPTSTADGDPAVGMADHLGRRVVVASGDRALLTQATPVTLTSTTETTLVTAGGSGVLLDLTYFHCENNSATIVRVDLRDATAGTVRDTFALAASGGSGGFVKELAPLKQITANNNWTVQLSAAVTDVRCMAQAVQVK